MANSRAIAARQSTSSEAVTKAGSNKKRPAQPQFDQIYNPLHFKHNYGVVYFLRIYMTVVAGAAAGILGLTGIPGFVLYLISQAACTVPILLKSGANIKKYFTNWTQVLVEHVFSSTAILSYILCWMIFYNLCHVF
eukprot:jgi/Chrzof1/11940/Cz06g15120.t1